MTEFHWITRDEAVKNREAALKTLGMTIEDWRALIVETDCCRGCVNENIRHERIYHLPYAEGKHMDAALEQLTRMDYLLGDDS